MENTFPVINQISPLYLHYTLYTLIDLREVLAEFSWHNSQVCLHRKATFIS